MNLTLTTIEIVNAAPIPLDNQYGFGIFSSFAEFINKLWGPLFNIIVIAIFFYFVFASFKFLTSGGDKEAISSAKNMITHAIIGLIALILLFIIFPWLLQVLEVNNLTIIK